MPLSRSQSVCSTVVLCGSTQRQMHHVLLTRHTCVHVHARRINWTARCCVFSPAGTTPRARLGRSCPLSFTTFSSACGTVVCIAQLQWRQACRALTLCSQRVWCSRWAGGIRNAVLPPFYPKIPVLTHAVNVSIAQRSGKKKHCAGSSSFTSSEILLTSSEQQVFPRAMALCDPSTSETQTKEVSGDQEGDNQYPSP